MRNFFQIFDIEERFLIDEIDLEAKYLFIQRQCHPDRFVDIMEKQIANKQTIIVNQAYDTLRFPYERLKYILTINGINVDSLKPTQEILEKIFKIRGGEKLARLHEIIKYDRIFDQASCVRDIEEMKRAGCILLYIRK